jgi:hypothetical protein
VQARFGLRRSWEASFSGCDRVVHLAANPAPDARWKEVARHNVEVTRNVLEAAARQSVPRVVFASSNYAVRAAELQLAPECYEPEGPKLDSSCPPRPLTAYGISKAIGEVLGRAAVDAGRLRCFVAVRIGCYSPKPAGAVEFRRRWVGPKDLASLLRRCLLADIQGFHAVYGVSGQSSSPYDLSYTKELLDWAPEENAQDYEGHVEPFGRGVARDAVSVSEGVEPGRS